MNGDSQRHGLEGGSRYSLSFFMFHWCRKLPTVLYVAAIDVSDDFSRGSCSCHASCRQASAIESEGLQVAPRRHAWRERHRGCRERLRRCFSTRPCFFLFRLGSLCVLLLPLALFMCFLRMFLSLRCDPRDDMYLYSHFGSSFPRRIVKKAGLRIMGSTGDYITSCTKLSGCGRPSRANIERAVNTLLDHARRYGPRLCSYSERGSRLRQRARLGEAKLVRGIHGVDGHFQLLDDLKSVSPGLIFTGSYAARDTDVVLWSVIKEMKALDPLRWKELVPPHVEVKWVFDQGNRLRNMCCAVNKARYRKNPPKWKRQLPWMQRAVRRIPGLPNLNYQAPEKLPPSDENISPSKFLRVVMEDEQESEVEENEGEDADTQLYADVEAKRKSNFIGVDGKKRCVVDSGARSMFSLNFTFLNTWGVRGV